MKQKLEASYRILVNHKLLARSLLGNTETIVKVLSARKLKAKEVAPELRAVAVPTGSGISS